MWLIGSANPALPTYWEHGIGTGGPAMRVDWQICEIFTIYVNMLTMFTWCMMMYLHHCALQPTLMPHCSWFHSWNDAGRPNTCIIIMYILQLKKKSGTYRNWTTGFHHARVSALGSSYHAHTTAYIPHFISMFWQWSNFITMIMCLLLSMQIAPLNTMHGPCGHGSDILLFHNYKDVQSRGKGQMRKQIHCMWDCNNST